MNPTTPPRRLNWGCGGHTAAGWINCDIKQHGGIDVSCDIRAGLPFDADSIDYAVSVHALQEIEYARQVEVLTELRRVLKPGGVLRLVLPDLLKGIQAYERGDRGYFLVPDEDARSLGGKLITQVLWYGYSRTLFTADFVTELLERAGYQQVAQCRYRQTASRFAGIIELDNREAESLYIEGTKPSSVWANVSGANS